MIDPLWRRRIEALRRAGLEYVPRVRFANLAPPGDVARPPEPNPFAAATEDPPIPRPPAATFQPVDLQTANKATDAASLFGAEEILIPPTAVSGSKEDSLRVLAAEVSTCTRCTVLASSRTQTVFSDGAAQAELCFVGEAPGYEEDRQGVPFVGPAGQLLTRIVEACRLKRQDVYICNVLKCRPPENRNPEWEEMNNCRIHLERQLAIVQPKVLVALGKFAAAFILGRRPDQVFITKIRGAWASYCGIPVMITLHPAYLLRNPDAKRDVWADMKAVMAKLGRPIEDQPTAEKQ